MTSFLTKAHMITALVDYPELCEPRMSFSEIVAILSRLSNDELAILDEDNFASALITLNH